MPAEIKRCPRCGVTFAYPVHFCPHCLERDELRQGTKPRPARLCVTAPAPAGSHEARLQALAAETLRQWDDVGAWCVSAGDLRAFEAAVIVAAARQFLEGGGYHG